VQWPVVPTRSWLRVGIKLIDADGRVVRNGKVDGLAPAGILGRVLGCESHGDALQNIRFIISTFRTCVQSLSWQMLGF
jgi:hypothetical protein